MKKALTILAFAVSAALAAGVNRNWGRLDGMRLVYAPDVLREDLSAPSDEDFAAAGFLHVEVDGPNPPQGFHVASSALTNDAARIWKVYVYEPDETPVLAYSKLKLVIAFEQIGKWDAVRAWIDRNGLADKWNACAFIRDDHEQFAAVTNAAVSAGLVTPAECKAVLEASLDD